MLGRFDDEWKRRGSVDESSQPLLSRLGWGPDHIMVMDLSVGHAAIFAPHGFPAIDVDDTGIYFCPLFRGFLEWLYQQDLSDLDALPDRVELEPVHMFRGPAPGEYRGRRG